MSDAILHISGLTVAFGKETRSVTALRDVNLELRSGQTLALVGESGSGKSVTSLTIMGLLPTNGRILSGSVHYKKRNGDLTDLTQISDLKKREIRGSEISMIFQEPMSSLNPLFTIGDQIDEMLLLHTDLDAAARRKRVVEMLELVEIPGAEARYDVYPHELSGGMRQRVMIALALVCNPALLIADEPTTALDVTIQAQILDLMRRLQKDLGMSILFITHDMGVVAEMADDVAVMYAGAIVEAAPVSNLFGKPTHPYTQGLLATIPRPGKARAERLVPIPGSVPALNDMPTGCAFAPRCKYKSDICSKPVALEPLAGKHVVACHNAGKVLSHV